MIKETLSFGIFMLVESAIILLLIGDLIRRTGRKLWRSRHPHVSWTNGQVFMAYLLCVFLYNIAETYSCLMNYIISPTPIALDRLTSRVVGRTLIMLAKMFLWYYTVKGGFDLFKDAKKK